MGQWLNPLVLLPRPHRFLLHILISLQSLYHRMSISISRILLSFVYLLELLFYKSFIFTWLSGFTYSMLGKGSFNAHLSIINETIGCSFVCTKITKLFKSSTNASNNKSWAYPTV